METDRDIAEAKAAVVEISRQFLDGKVGVIEAARAISSHRHTVDPDMNDTELLYFLGVDSESDGLTVGALLNEWHPSVRDAKIQEVRAFEDFYRADALRDAAILVERYARPPNEEL